MERKPNGLEPEIQLTPQARQDQTFSTNEAQNVQISIYPSQHFFVSLSPMAPSQQQSNPQHILAQPKLVFEDKSNKTCIQNLVQKPNPISAKESHMQKLFHLLSKRKQTISMQNPLSISIKCRQYNKR